MESQLVQETVANVEQALVNIGLIGGAVLLVKVGIKIYKWLHRSK